MSSAPPRTHRSQIIPRQPLGIFATPPQRPAPRRVPRFRLSILPDRYKNIIAQSIALGSLFLCGQGESNSRLILGKDVLYHLTMAAMRLFIPYEVGEQEVFTPAQATSSAPFFIFWCARQDSNPQPLVPKTSALSIELRARPNSIPRLAIMLNEHLFPKQNLFKGCRAFAHFNTYTSLIVWALFNK